MPKFFQSAPNFKSSHLAALLFSYGLGEINDRDVGKALCHSLQARYYGALGGAAFNVALQRNSHIEAHCLGIEAKIVVLARTRLAADFKVFFKAGNHLPLVEARRAAINFLAQSFDSVAVRIERL